MKIVVSGASGFIGSAVVTHLRQAGHRVYRLVRSRPTNIDQIEWDPQKPAIDLTSLEGMDALIHLAGENISSSRWTPDKKARIRESRIGGTRLLCESLARLSQPPKVLLSASAIGFYGNRGEQLLYEHCAAGEDFLARVCREWEDATASAAQRGIRVVRMRLGIVLSAAGGALERMLPPFRMGVAGVLGSGRQYVSWIALDDAIGAIDLLLENEEVSGAVNLVSPYAVTNAEFAATLGLLVGHPRIVHVPAFAVRVAFGELADVLLLASQRVCPGVLQASGYQYQHPHLREALTHLLSNAPPKPVASMQP